MLLRESLLLATLTLLSNLELAATKDEFRKEPKIITTDGNLKFQSATNRNISFALSGNSDLIFDGQSVKSLFDEVSKQKSEIQKLKEKPTVQDKCASLGITCQNNGACVTTSQDQAGYKCICQPGFTGDRCETKINVGNVCSVVTCNNGGFCQVTEQGAAVCKCQDEWFGRFCDMPRPTQCNFKLQNNVGFINSPGFPEGYPPNARCTWNIRLTDDKSHDKIELVFLMTTLGVPQHTCNADYVEIEDVKTQTQLTKVCGTVNSKTLVSLSNEVRVTFQAGPASLGIGFSLFYDRVEGKCGSRLTEPSGKFSSPDYPTGSSDHLYCQWTIDLGRDDEIALTFDSFNIVNTDESCANYIEVTSESGVIERFCGLRKSLNPPTLRGSKLNVLFVSQKGKDNWFHATYDIECNQKVILEEGGVFEFSSPYHPQPYPSRKHCQWSVQGPEGSALRLTTEAVDFQSSALCALDHINVYGDYQKKTELTRYCHNSLFLPVLTKGNEMLIEYVTGGNALAFSGTVSVLKTDCGDTIHHSDDSGVITSPMSDDLRTYPSLMYCEYLIAVPEGSVVLSFVLFDIKTTPNCAQDYVQFFDGDSTHHELLFNNTVTGGRFCGSKLPPVIESSGRSLLVVFHSGDTSDNTAEGFSAAWEARKVALGCNQVIDVDNTGGTISSPGYPSNYQPGKTCTYSLQSKEGHLIKLDFGSFDLQDSVLCQADALRIYDGANNGSRLLGTFCGENSPKVIVSSGNYLSLELSTDNVNEALGFFAKYFSGTNLCGGYIHSPSGFISSPNYPRTYQPSLYCVWHIKTTPGQTIKIKYRDVDIMHSEQCFQDYLQVMDFPLLSTDRPQRVCNGYHGNQQDFVSRGDLVQILFKSSATVAAGVTGFRLQFEASCGGELTARSGTIYSPNFPGPYPPLSECEYTIRGQPDDTVLVTVSSLDVQYSQDCQADRLEIGQAGSNDLQKFCGNLYPEPLTFDHSAIVRFVSNMETSGLGFRIKYSLQGCSADFFGANGTFTSPGYPTGYPANAECHWRIRVQPGQVVKLSVDEYDLRGTCSDNFTVYDGYTTQAPSLGSYCSQDKLLMLTSHTNEMLIVFKSDRDHSAKGFRAKYEATEPACGGALFDTGTFHSPNYPSSYPANQKCTWIIMSQDDHLIQLSFEHFDLEPTPADSVCGDAVYIYIDDVVHAVCGKSIPKPVVGKNIMVSFESNQRGTATGFKANFKKICGGELVLDDSTSQYITSPNYPQKYPAGTCEWIVRAPPGDKVTLAFETFDLQQSDPCKDFVEVFNGGVANDELLVRKMCGTTITNSITSSGNTMTVRFTADGKTSHTGFKAKLSSIPNACGGTLRSGSGVIASPNFPQGSTDSMECVWDIEVAEGNLITLNMKEMNIEESKDCVQASLSVFDGSSSQAMAVACGSDKDDFGFGGEISSLSNKVSVKFRLYESNSENKFQLEFSTLCFGLVIDASTGSGFLESPGYPNHYEPNKICAWQINAPPGGVIRASFVDFDLEVGEAGNCADYSAAFDNNNYEEPIGYWCGFATPEPIISLTSSLVFSFVTDNTIQNTGFKLQYEIIHDSCEFELTATQEEGVIESPSYPEDYPNKKRCRWVISTASGQSIQLTFTDFVLEEASFTGECIYDYVKIHDLHNNQQTKLGHLCATMGQEMSYHTNGNTMIVDFQSDEDYSYKGFQATYKSVCGGLRKTTVGTIESSSSDASFGGYLPNQNCLWSIEYEAGAVIDIKFHRFHLEHSNCKDRLVVRAGTTLDSPVINTFCYNNATNFTSTGSSLSFQFITDAQRHAAGFKLSYERIVDGCGGKLELDDADVVGELASPSPYPKNVECMWTLHVPQGRIVEFSFLHFNMTGVGTCFSDYTSLQDGLLTDDVYIAFACNGYRPPSYPLVSSDNIMQVKFVTSIGAGSTTAGWKAIWKIGCGGHYTSTSGNLSSPEYPSPYLANENCTYTLELPTQQQIHIDFQSFNLAGDCSQDSLTIYDGVRGQRKLIGTYCGNSLPQAVKTLSNKATLVFLSDTNQQGNGFHANYYAVGNECGGTFYGSNGVIVSPFYPHAYPFNRRCVWTITYELLKKVKVKFTSIDLEQSPNCTNDYVLITDNFSKKRYCGNTLPAEFTSASHTITVEFVSDGNQLRGNGFRMEYEEHDPEACGGVLTADQGVITSPGYPNADGYDINLQCTWKIQTNSSFLIQFKIEDQDIEEVSGCYFDHLIIRDSESADVADILRTCGGDGKGFEFKTNGHVLYVQFVSDYEANGLGFKASYTLIPKPACGGIIQNTNGIITSPNYPEAYTGDSCSWYFKPPEGHTIRFSIEALDLPADCTDSVTIYNGDNSVAPELAKLCGGLAQLAETNFKSDSDRLFVRFDVTTRSRDHKGFKITYRTHTAGCGDVIIAKSGVISSPSYPAPYQDPFECVWTIESPPGTNIFVYFHELNMLASPSCKYDVLEFRDGATQDSELLTSVCGRRHDSVVKSSSNRMFIRQKLSAWNDKKVNGFNITFNTGCGGILTGVSGYVASPGFPGPYPTDLNCQYILRADSHYHIEVTTPTFDLPPANAFGECKDYVAIFQGNSTTAPRLFKACGNEPLPDYSFASAEYNEVLLQFVSDSTPETQYKGAKAHYVAKCGTKTIGEEKGDIVYPPSDMEIYLESEICEWTVQFPAFMTIKIELKKFDVEEGGECSFDSLELRDGDSSSSPLIGRFCGNDHPPELHTSGNLLYVKFTSDSSIQRGGFKLSYSANEELACGGVLTKSSGKIEAPSIGQKLNCGWSIVVEEGKKVELTIDSFNLNSSTTDECANYITFFNSKHPNSQYMLDKYMCGNMSVPSEPILSVSNEMYVWYRKRAPFLNQEQAGFTLSYKTVDSDCGGKFMVSDQSQTINYPGHMLQETTCDWLLESAPGSKIEITMDEINLSQKKEDVCQGTNLVLRSGQTMTQYEHILCEPQKGLVFHSVYNVLRVSLNIIGQNNKKLKLHYRTLTSCNETLTELGGLITSPNYPYRYPHHSNCQHLIQAPAGAKVVVYPVRLDIEAPRDGDCVYDNLTLYANETANGHLDMSANLTFCGDDINAMPVSLTSHSNSMAVQFKSDTYDHGTGFALTYSTIMPGTECGGEIRGRVGMFTSPNYPRFYDGAYECSWNIQVEEGYVVELQLEHFEVESPADGADCSTADYVELIDGADSWGKFCRSHPAKRASQSNKVTVRFHSNAVNNNYRGFQLTYKRALQ